MEEVRRINNRGQVVCVIELDGLEFKRYPNGKHGNYFYHKWKEDGEYKQIILHQYIYEKKYGKLPKGMVVHHKDFNPLNNSVENLVAVTIAEHMRIHANLVKWKDENQEEFKKRGYSKENWQERRAKVLLELAAERRVCEWCGEEYTPTNTHQRFCSKQCHHKWQYKAPENNIEMVCQYCGKTFLGNKYLKPKCCSEECAHQMVISKRYSNRG